MSPAVALTTSTIHVTTAVVNTAVRCCRTVGSMSERVNGVFEPPTIGRSSGSSSSNGSWRAQQKARRRGGTEVHRLYIYLSIRSMYYMSTCILTTSWIYYCCTLFPTSFLMITLCIRTATRTTGSSSETRNKWTELTKKIHKLVRSRTRHTHTAIRVYTAVLLIILLFVCVVLTLKSADCTDWNGF